MARETYQRSHVDLKCHTTVTDLADLLLLIEDGLLPYFSDRFLWAHLQKHIHGARMIALDWAENYDGKADDAK